LLSAERRGRSEICNIIVDEILFKMFGVRPLTGEEKVVKGLVLGLISKNVEKGSIKC
jgi:hypothetical protein